MIKLPQNVGGKDRLVRKLDCSVINHLHRIVKIGNLQPIDTVRAVFDEGEQLYNTSGFKNKVHIQFCVCNPKMIKGVFRVTPTIPTSIVFNQTT